MALAADVPTSTVRTILDLGMHDAYDTFSWLRAGYRVVAVDGSPKVSERLKLARCHFSNGIMSQVPNLIVLHRAIDIVSNATVPFCVNRNTASSRVLGVDDVCPEHVGKRVKVRTISCSDLIRTYGRAWTIKIDIEGREEACIKSILTLPDQMLPTFISFESPLRAPTWRHKCDTKCVETLLRIVRVMAARGYKDWKRHWWRAQKQNGGVLARHVQDLGNASASTWVSTSEVERMGCGFFPVADASTQKLQIVRHVIQSTGCDLFARHTSWQDADASEGQRSLLLPNKTLFKPHIRAWANLCRAGSRAEWIMVETRPGARPTARSREQGTLRRLSHRSELAKH